MKYYFEKTENDIAYRICLMNLNNEPWLCRSVKKSA